MSDEALTPEDRWFLAMVAAGTKQTAIGRRADLNKSAVYRRLQVIYRKLGARSAEHAVAIAMRRGDL